MENKPSRQIKQVLSEYLPEPESIKIRRTEYRDKRVVLRIELSREQNEKLEKLKALKSHQGDLNQLMENWIDRDLKSYENKRFRKTKFNNPRFVSKTLRNYKLEQANGKCQFPGCDSTQFLQIDHIIPVSKGSRADPRNLQVLCRAHNQFKGSGI